MKADKPMNANLSISMLGLGAAIAVVLIGMKTCDAIRRNPGSTTRILVQSILAIAFAEAIVFYTLFLVR